MSDDYADDIFPIKYQLKKMRKNGLLFLFVIEERSISRV